LRKKFSEQYGFKKVTDSFQINSINQELSNRLWNTIKIFYIDPIKTQFGVEENCNIPDGKTFNFIKNIYDGFFKTHEEPNINKRALKENFKQKYFKLKWFEIYDLLEFISSIFYDESLNKKFRIKINTVLENESSGYRFIDDYITPIIDNVEIKEIEEALECKYSGVKRHLSSSLELLSDRENPDYVNSIKESISAVESILNILSETTNVALNKSMNNLPFEMDKNFKAGMVRLYSWTSSADGIRHGVTGEEIQSAFEEAKYMLVSCSAFINYLIGKQIKT
jgi:hypothetical protein